MTSTRRNFSHLLACLALAALFLAGNVPFAAAHQSVSPKLVKLVGKPPVNVPPCYVNGVPTAACIEKGRKLLETGTSGGNGRTCASCHPASNNFTICPASALLRPRALLHQSRLIAGAVQWQDGSFVQKLAHLQIEKRAGARSPAVESSRD